MVRNREKVPAARMLAPCSLTNPQIVTKRTFAGSKNGFLGSSFPTVTTDTNEEMTSVGNPAANRITGDLAGTGLAGTGLAGG